MRKTSRTFLTLGTVFGFIFGILFLILGAVFAVVGKMKVDQNYIQAFQELIVKNFGGDIEKFRGAVFAYGIIFIIMGLCSIASGVLCIIAKPKPKMGNLIAVIVVTALGGSIFGLLGGIFGLIANAQENRQPQQPMEQ